MVNGVASDVRPFPHIYKRVPPSVGRDESYYTAYGAKMRLPKNLAASFLSENSER